MITDTQLELDALKRGLRLHRHIDAVRALRDLIGLGLSNWRDDYPDKHPNVPLKICADIVRAVQDVLDEPTGCMEPETDDAPASEWIVNIWPDYDSVAAKQGHQQGHVNVAYRYFNYYEALEDAKRYLHDNSFGSNPTISVSRVISVSQITRTMMPV